MKSAGSAMAMLFSVSAWAVMPSAGEPVVHEPAAAPTSNTSATTRPASSQTDALVHLHRAATGAYFPAHLIVDASARCCESARAAR
ncbi:MULTISPECIES: hypothetical protein [Methyloversatilis]|uniref:hypothetical protein n=1 Tax=Methyloversatilis TaxID=378210 RepID=UPI0026EB82BE|nr:hypothetical protein [Methyloversatilis discipulorum]